MPKSMARFSSRIEEIDRGGVGSGVHRSKMAALCKAVEIMVTLCCVSCGGRVGNLSLMALRTQGSALVQMP